MEIHMEKVGDMEMINCSINSSEICRCKELEERSVKAEARCAELELELQKKRKYCEALEGKLNSLENEKSAMDDKPKSLSISGEVNIIDSDDEPNIITQQPVLDNQDSGNISFSTCDAAAEEKLSDNSLKGSFYGGKNEDLNSVRDVQFTAICKRKRARNVVTSESENDDGDGDDSGGGGGRGDDGDESDDDDVPISQLKRMQFLKVSPNQVRCDSNELVTVTSPTDDHATGPVTHRRRLRKRVIKSQQDKKCSCGHSDDKHEQSISVNKETGDDEFEEVSSDNEEGSLSNFIVHDSDESVYEDTSSKSQEASDGEEDKMFSCGPSEDKHEQSIPTNKENDDDDESEQVSDNEEGSLCNFIDHDSDVSEGTSSKSDDASDGEVESDSQDVADGDLNLKEILSQIQRKKDQKRKWVFEGDMLAAFGKDPQLCMKAVCTLYRQQTSEEQRKKESVQDNGRGFNSVDAFRGSTLAEFITDGDPLCDVKKTVKELEEYDARGVETCRTMALRYSKQLFEIYNNKEDPFFP